ncbi:purine-cytosine permease family protein [Pseudonocardia spinosispora]|uniref:purine-cytosine permease family protein n=1 Tax=Pseudonocardia spinosispora TaxID=103441 RepID=UPI00041F78E9|nr:cytosine permease [Pseudonocardia spinosispora]
MSESEEALARRYRQPKGIEQYGVEAIPDEKKTVRWWDVSFMILNFLINPGMILIAGGAVAAGLPFWAAVAAMTGGIVVAFAAYSVMATVGVDYGLPGQVGTRITFGLRGAQWIPSALHMISSVYWFAFQTVAGALGIIAVLRGLTGQTFSFALVSVLFAVIQAAVALIGYDSVKVLSRVAFPVKILLSVVFIVVLMTNDAPGYSPGEVLGFAGHIPWQWPLIALWLGSVVSAWLSMITNASDFCRYSRSRVDMWAGTMAAAVIGTLITAFVGCYAAAASGGNANAFDVLAQITHNPLLLGVVLLYIVLDNWTINVLNLYTAGLALVNIVRRLGRFWATLGLAVIGIALSLLPELVNGFTGFMTVMGNFFAPVAGVLIADYLFGKRMSIVVPELFDRKGRYWYWSGFNWLAVGWVVAGFGIYLLLPEVTVPSVSCTLIVLLGYALTARLLGRLPALHTANEPVTAREASMTS